MLRRFRWATNGNALSPLLSQRIKVVDFFCGCGGTSAGMQLAGMDVILGIDHDRDAARTWAANFPSARVLPEDITLLPTEALDPYIPANRVDPLLFVACAPCQPFSKQKRGLDLDDPRASLLWELMRFVERYGPEVIFLENVPGLKSLATQLGPFNIVVSELMRLGYWVRSKVVDSEDYGVPQVRKRLVLIASRLGRISFPMATHGPGKPQPYASTWDWIGGLPPIEAGEAHPEVPNHRASSLSPLNLRRIKATREGGGREDWPPELLAPCHGGGFHGFSDVYGRMRRGGPSTGLTTRCISYSNGRFGHPVQDRAISVREAACLQTFPMDFVFFGSMNSMARQIGNAVPVLLAYQLGRGFIHHAKKHRLSKALGDWSRRKEPTYGSV